MAIEDLELEKIIAASDGILIDVDSDAIGNPAEADSHLFDVQTDLINLDCFTNNYLIK